MDFTNKDIEDFKPFYKYEEEKEREIENKRQSSQYFTGPESILIDISLELFSSEYPHNFRAHNSSNGKRLSLSVSLT